jgi:hypothetical protein
MKIVKLILVLSPLVVILLLFNYTKRGIIAKVKGPNTEEMVDRQFQNVLNKNFDILILGNSRTFQAIDPASLDKKAYNFSFNSDTYHHYFYKLKWLKEKNVHFKNVILGVDYFEFSRLINDNTRYYKKYFDSSFLAPYDSINNPKWNLINFDPINQKVNKYMNENYTQLIFPYFEGIKQCIHPNKNLKIPYLTDFGFSGTYNHNEINNDYSRDSTILNFQLDYFNKTLEFCKSGKIGIILIIVPFHQKGLVSYTESQMKKFDEFYKKYALDYGGQYLNFSRNLRGVFKDADYENESHLNVYGMRKFTVILNDTLNSIIK